MTDTTSDTSSQKLYRTISDTLDNFPDIREPILYALKAKITNKSLAGIGVDCYIYSKFTDTPEDQRLNMAAAFELAWTCILLYDDILDNDKIRYGLPTAWIKYGKPAAEQSYKQGLAIAAKLHPKQLAPARTATKNERPASESVSTTIEPMCFTIAVV